MCPVLLGRCHQSLVLQMTYTVFFKKMDLYWILLIEMTFRSHSRLCYNMCYNMPVFLTCTVCEIIYIETSRTYHRFSLVVGFSGSEMVDDVLSCFEWITYAID